MEDNKNNQVGGTPTSTDNGANGGKTFTQADMDALAGKIRNEEKAKHDQAVKDAIASALEEERRQAKLTAEEREKEAKTKREAELKAREEQITLRERKIAVQEKLKEKNVPTELADFLVDLDEKITDENIEKMVKVYNKSVEDGVAGKLKGNPPTDFSQNNNGDERKKISSAF